MKFGIQCNFPHFCGEERTKEALDILNGLISENEKLLKTLQWIKKQYDDDFTEDELRNLCTRDKVIYNTLKKILKDYIS